MSSGSLLEWHTSLSVGSIGSLDLWDSLADDCLGNDDGGLAVVETLCLGNSIVDGTEVVACDIIKMAG